MHWRWQKILHGLSQLKHALIDSNPPGSGDPWDPAFFEQVVKSLGFSISTYHDMYKLEKNRRTFFLRKGGSDGAAFIEIFRDGEYNPLIEFIRNNRIEVHTLVDAGANIGLASILFAEHLPVRRTLCIEPFGPNCQMLEKNLQGKCDFTVIEAALWHRDDEVLALHRHFRDGQDWSLSTGPAGSKADLQPVKSITLHQLMQQHQLPAIDLLKVDIEGAEQVVFAPGSKTGFLKQVKLVAIELHREIIGYRKIFGVLQGHGFILHEAGNLLIGYRPPGLIT